MLGLTVFGCVLLVLTLTAVPTHQHKRHCSHTPNLIHEVDPGEPLLLTPLLKSGNTSEAREKAAVYLRDFPDLISFSGFLTVNEEWQSNMFFWYFPALVNSENAPIIIWLEGGPGASSLFSMLNENGPLQATSYGLVKPRRYSWHRKFNMIYIDNPVGTGYSYTENDNGYAETEEDVGRDLLETVKQLYVLFPEFEKLKLYVTGGSYAGKYVPALAYAIHKDKEQLSKQGKKTAVDIKLGGLAIGNGFTDPLTQIDYGDNLYALGLIDENDLKTFHEKEAAIRECVKINDIDCVDNLTRGLTTNDMGTLEGTLFHNATGLLSLFNYLEDEFDLRPLDTMIRYVQMPKIRRSIHVGNNTFIHLNPSETFTNKIKGDLLRSVAPWVEELLNYYPVCVFHGQMDMEIPYRPTIRYLQKLQFNGSENFKTAERKVWRVDGEVAGYVKQAGKLTVILIRNAGHLAVADQPKWSFDMIDRCVNGRF